MNDPQSFQAIGWIALAIFGLAGGINQVLGIVDRIKGKPHAEQLQASNEHLSARFDQLEQDVESLRDEIRAERGTAHRESDDRRRAVYSKIEDLRIELKMDGQTLHDKIVAVATQVAGLETSSHLTNQRIAQIDGKLDRLIERKA